MITSAATGTIARERVVREALSWVGTPYHHHGRLRGVGVDCAMLLAEVYSAAGVIERPAPGIYPVDWHLHRNEEIFLGWLGRVGAWRTDEPRPGDVAIYRFGRTFSHGAVVVDDELRVVHSYIRLGVVLGRQHEAPLHGRPVQFWSVIE